MKSRTRERNNNIRNEDIHN